MIHNKIVIIHNYKSINNTNIFLFVMLCMMCSSRRWETNIQILKGKNLVFKYFKYIYTVQQELPTERYVITAS